MFRLMSLFLGFALPLTYLGSPRRPAAPARFIAPPGQTADSAVELPKPTGPHGVGTVIYQWTDESRADVVSEAPDDKRRLVVQIWYPVEVKESSQAAPYMPELAALRAVLQQDESLRDAMRQDLFARVRTNSAPLAKLSKAGAKYPVVVFSHGTGVPRSYYTMLMEELASRGYVVAGVDHPYMGVVAVNGKAVEPHPRWTEPPPGGLRHVSDEVRDAYWLPGDTQLSADQRFVLDRLEQLNRRDPDGRFTRRLDLKRVGMAGHSHGFLSQTCGKDARFKACLSLEGVPAMAERRSGFRQPFMAMRDEVASPRETPIYENLRNVGYDVLIPGAGHNGFLDLPVQSAYKFGYKLDAVRLRRIINAYMLAFFDTHLKGKKSRLLEKPSPDFPEVVFTAYGPKPKKQ